MTSSNGSPSYDVIFSDLQLQTIEKLHEQAFEKGLGDAFLDALRFIEKNLRNDPIHFGDPLYTLPAAKLIVYLRAVYPVAVDYGVHQEKAIVFIRSIRLFG
jgi:hypothetical protein